MTNSLLKEARKLPTLPHKEYDMDDEDVELVFGWLREEITLSQMTRVKGMKRGSASIYSYVTRVLKTAYDQGRLGLK